MSTVTQDPLAPIRRDLMEREPASLSPAEYGAFARRIRGVERDPDVTLALLSNFTLSPFPDYARVHLARENLLLEPVASGFGQYFQAVIDPASDLRGRELDAIFLVLSLRLLRPREWGALSSLGAREREALRNDVLDHVEQWLTAAGRWFTGELLVGNFIVPTRPGAGIADASDPYGEVEFHLDLNLRLLQRLKEASRARLFDIDRLAGRYGKDRAHDPKMLHLAKMEWSQPFLPTVADELARHVNASLGRARKCLVLDLDNTLWGGVVGEEGTAGIKIGPGDPVGEAYLALQQRIKTLQGRGIILAVCSKNNPEDALAVFNEREEMLLQRDDFAEVAINWDSKPQNLQRIAAALNIGLDSLVFVDDNPAEIAMVEAALPEVETVLLAGDPATFAGRLDALTSFEKSVILDDDRTKTQQYRENRDREALREEIGDLRQYLASLEMRLTIRPAEEADLPRLEQLFQKTNQFNVTTRRHARGDLDHFMSDPGTELWLFSAADRFGAMGTIGTFVLERREDELVIESFLMSCRAMGRGLETEVMNSIKRKLLEDPEISALRARFIPTRKNVPVRSFFDEQGFEVINSEASGESVYRLTREKCSMSPCHWIEVHR